MQVEELFGIRLITTSYLKDNWLLIVGQPKKTEHVVASVYERSWLEIPTREMQFINTETGEVRGDEITMATEIRATEEGMEMLTHLIERKGK